jgi:hypothetical protein
MLHICTSFILCTEQGPWNKGIQLRILQHVSVLNNIIFWNGKMHQVIFPSDFNKIEMEISSIVEDAVSNLPPK